MRSGTASVVIGMLLVAGCDSPPPQPPPEGALVNGTRTDQAFPSGADGNQIITGSGTANTPGGAAPSSGSEDGDGQQTNAQSANQQGTSE